MEQFETYRLPKRKSSFSVDLGPNDPIKLNVFTKYLRKSYTKLKTSRFILLVKSCSSKFRFNQKSSEHAQKKENEIGEIPSRVILDHSVFTLKKPKRVMPDECDNGFQCGDFGTIHNRANCKQSHLSSCPEASCDNKLKITVESGTKESKKFYLSLCNCLEKRQEERIEKEEVLFKNYYTIPANTNFQVFPIKVDLPFLKASKDVSTEKKDKNIPYYLKRKTSTKLTEHSDRKSKTKDLEKKRKLSFDDIPWKEDFAPLMKKHYLGENAQDNSLYVYNVSMQGKQKHSSDKKHHHSDEERRSSTPKEHGDIIEATDKRDHKHRAKTKKIKVKTSKADCKRKPREFEKNFVTYVEVSSDEIQQEKTSKDNLKKLITMYKEAITDSHLSSSKSFSVIKEESTENTFFIQNEEVKSSKSEITSSSDSLYFNKRKRTSFLKDRSAEITELSEIYAITQNSTSLTKPKHEIRYHLADRKINSESSNQLSDNENVWSKLISSTCTSLTKESIANLTQNMDCAVLPKILQLLAKNKNSCIDNETQYESFADKTISTDLSLREDSEHSMEREVCHHDLDRVHRKKLSSRTSCKLLKKEQKSDLDSRSISFIEGRVGSTKAVNTGRSLFSMKSNNQDIMDESTITDLTLRDLEKNEKRLDEIKNQEASMLLELKEKERQRLEMLAAQKHVSTCVSNDFLSDKAICQQNREAKYKKCTSETFTENIYSLRHFSDESGDSDSQHFVEEKLPTPIEVVPLHQINNNCRTMKTQLNEATKERFPKFIGYSIYDPTVAVKKLNQSYSFHSGSQYKKKPLIIKSASKEEGISKYLNIQERNNSTRNSKQTIRKRPNLKPKSSLHITSKHSDNLTPIKEEGGKQDEIKIPTKPVNELIEKIRKECDFIETNILDSSKLLPRLTMVENKTTEAIMLTESLNTQEDSFSNKLEKPIENLEKSDFLFDKPKSQYVPKKDLAIPEDTVKMENTEQSISKVQCSIDNISEKDVVSIEGSKIMDNESFSIIKDSVEILHPKHNGKSLESFTKTQRPKLCETTTRDYIFPTKLELPFHETNKSKENACQTTCKITKTTSKVHSVLSSMEQKEDNFNVTLSTSTFQTEENRSTQSLNATKKERKNSRIPVLSKQVVSKKIKSFPNNSMHLEENYTTELRNLLSIDNADVCNKENQEVVGKNDASTTISKKSELEIKTSPREIIAITLENDFLDLTSMMEVFKFGGKRKTHNLNIINTIETLDIDSVNGKKNNILEEKRSKQIGIENKPNLLERKYQNWKRKNKDGTEEVKENIVVQNDFEVKKQDKGVIGKKLNTSKKESKQKLNKLKPESTEKVNLDLKFCDKGTEICLQQNENVRDNEEKEMPCKGEGINLLISMDQEKTNDERLNSCTEKINHEKIGREERVNSLDEGRTDKNKENLHNKKKLEDVEENTIISTKEDKKSNKTKNVSRRKQPPEEEIIKQHCKINSKHKLSKEKSQLVLHSESEHEKENSKNNQELKGLKKRTEVYLWQNNRNQNNIPSEDLKEDNIKQYGEKDLQVTYINPASFTISDNDSTEGSSMYENKKENVKISYMNPLILDPSHSEKPDKNKHVKATKSKIIKEAIKKERSKTEVEPINCLKQENCEIEMIFQRRKDDIPLIQDLNNDNCSRKKVSQVLKHTPKEIETRKLFAIEEREEIIVTERTDTVDLRCFRNEIPDFSSNCRVIQDNRNGSFSKPRKFNQSNSVTQRTFARSFVRRESPEPERKTRTLTIEEYFAKSTNIHPNFIKGVIRWISSKLYKPTNSPLVGITSDTNICMEFTANQINKFFDLKKLNLCKLLNLLSSYLKRFLTSSKIIIIKADFINRTIQISILNIRLPETAIRIEDFKEKHQIVNTCKVLTIRNFFEFHRSISTSSLSNKKISTPPENKKQNQKETFNKQTSMVRLEKVSESSQNIRKEFQVRSFPTKLRPIASQFRNLRILKVSLPKEIKLEFPETDMEQTKPVFKELAPIETIVEKEIKEETVSETVSENEFYVTSKESLTKSSSFSMKSLNLLNEYVPRALPDFGIKKSTKYEITIPALPVKIEKIKSKPIKITKINEDKSEILLEFEQKEVKTKKTKQDLNKTDSEAQFVDKVGIIGSYKIKEMTEEKIAQEKRVSLPVVPIKKRMGIKSEKNKINFFGLEKIPEVFEENIAVLDEENQKKLRNEQEEEKSVGKLVHNIRKTNKLERKKLRQGKNKAIKQTIIKSETKPEVFEQDVPILDRNKLRKDINKAKSFDKTDIMVIGNIKKKEKEQMGQEKGKTVAAEKITIPKEVKAVKELVGIKPVVFKKNITTLDDDNQRSNQRKVMKNAKSVDKPEIALIRNIEEIKDEQLGQEKGKTVAAEKITKPEEMKANISRFVGIKSKESKKNDSTLDDKYHRNKLRKDVKKSKSVDKPDISLIRKIKEKEEQLEQEKGKSVVAQKIIKPEEIKSNLSVSVKIKPEKFKENISTLDNQNQRSKLRKDVKRTKSTDKSEIALIHKIKGTKDKQVGQEKERTVAVRKIIKPEEVKANISAFVEIKPVEFKENITTFDNKKRRNKLRKVVKKGTSVDESDVTLIRNIKGKKEQKKEKPVAAKTIIKPEDVKENLFEIIGIKPEEFKENISSLSLSLDSQNQKNKLQKDKKVAKFVAKPEMVLNRNIKENEKEQMEQEKGKTQKIIKPKDVKANLSRFVGIKPEGFKGHISNLGEENQRKLKKNYEEKSLDKTKIVQISKMKDIEKQKKCDLLDYKTNSSALSREETAFEQGISEITRKQKSNEKVVKCNGFLDVLLPLNEKSMVRNENKEQYLKDIKYPSNITLTFGEKVLDILKDDVIDQMPLNLIKLNLEENKNKHLHEQKTEGNRIDELKDFALKLKNQESSSLHLKETINNELNNRVLVSDDENMSRKEAMTNDLEIMTKFDLEKTNASPAEIASSVIDQKSVETLKSIPSIASFELLEAEENSTEDKHLFDSLVLSKVQDASKIIDVYAEEIPPEKSIAISNEEILNTIKKDTELTPTIEIIKEIPSKLEQRCESEKYQLLPSSLSNKSLDDHSTEEDGFKLIKNVVRSISSDEEISTAVNEGCCDIDDVKNFPHRISSKLNIVSESEIKILKKTHKPLVGEEMFELKQDELISRSKTLTEKDDVTPTTTFIIDKKEDEEETEEPITQSSLNIYKKLIQLTDKTKILDKENFVKYGNISSTLQELDMNEMASFLKKLFPILTTTQTMLTQHPEFIICTCNVPNLDEERKSTVEEIQLTQDEGAPAYTDKKEITASIIRSKEEIPEKIHQLIKNMSLHIVLNIPENEDLPEDKNQIKFKEAKMQQTDLLELNQNDKRIEKILISATALQEKDDQFVTTRKTFVDKQINTDFKKPKRKKNRRTGKYLRSKKNKNVEKRPICLCSVPSDLINNVLARRELIKDFQKCMCDYSSDFSCRCRSNTEKESKIKDTIVPLKVCQENEVQTDNLFHGERTIEQIVIDKSNQSVVIINQQEAYGNNSDILISYDVYLKKKSITSIHPNNSVCIGHANNSSEDSSDEKTQFDALFPLDKYSDAYSIVRELTRNLIDFIFYNQQTIEEENLQNFDSTDESYSTTPASYDNSDIIPVISELIHEIIDETFISGETDEKTLEDVSKTIDIIVEKISIFVNEHSEVLSGSCNVMALDNHNSSNINVSGDLEIPKQTGSTSRRYNKNIRSSKVNRDGPSKERKRKPTRKHKSRKKEEDVICLYIPSDSEESDKEFLIIENDTNTEEEKEDEAAEKEDEESLSKVESGHFFTSTYFAYVPWFCRPSKSLTEQETFNILRHNTHTHNTTSSNDVEIVPKGEPRSSKVNFNNVYNEKPTNTDSRHYRKESKRSKCVCPKKEVKNIERASERKDSSIKNKIPKFPVIKSKHASKDSISNEMLLKKMPFACNFNIPASISGLPSKMSCDVKHYLSSISKHFQFQNKTKSNTFEDANVHYSIEEKQSQNACKLKIDIKPHNKLYEDNKPPAAACNINSIRLEFEFAGKSNRVEEKKQSTELVDVSEDTEPKKGKQCRCKHVSSGIIDEVTGDSEDICRCVSEENTVKKEKYKPLKKPSIKTLLAAKAKRSKKVHCTCFAEEKPMKKETIFSKPIVEDAKVGSSIPFLQRKKSHQKKVSKKNLQNKLVSVCVQSSIAESLKAMQDVKMETSPTIKLCACTSTCCCSQKVSKSSLSMPIQEQILLDKTTTIDSQMREAQEMVNVSIPYIPKQPKQKHPRNNSETYEIETKIQDFEKYSELETEHPYFKPNITSALKYEETDGPTPVENISSIETLPTHSSTGSKTKIKVASTIQWEDVGAIEREKMLMVTPTATPERGSEKQLQQKIDTNLVEVNKRLENTLAAIANENEEHEILSKEYGFESEVPVGFRKPRSSLEIILGDDPLIEEAQQKGILPEDPISVLKSMDLNGSGKKLNSEIIPTNSTEASVNIHDKKTVISESNSQNKEIGENIPSDQQEAVKSELDEPKSKEDPVSDGDNEPKVIQTILTMKLDDSKNELDQEDEEYKSFSAALKKQMQTSSVEDFKVDEKEHDNENNIAPNKEMPEEDKPFKDQNYAKSDGNALMAATAKMLDEDKIKESLASNFHDSENPPFLEDEKYEKGQGNDDNLKPNLVEQMNNSNKEKIAANINEGKESEEDEYCNIHEDPLNEGETESLDPNKIYLDQYVNKEVSENDVAANPEDQKIKNKEYELYYFTKVSPSHPKVRIRSRGESFPTVFENEVIPFPAELQTEDRSTSTQVIPFITYTVTPFDLVFVKETATDNIQIGDNRQEDCYELCCRYIDESYNLSQCLPIKRFGKRIETHCKYCKSKKCKHVNPLTEIEKELYKISDVLSTEAGKASDYLIYGIKRKQIDTGSDLVKICDSACLEYKACVTPAQKDEAKYDFITAELPNSKECSNYKSLFNYISPEKDIKTKCTDALKHSHSKLKTVWKGHENRPTEHAFTPKKTNFQSTVNISPSMIPSVSSTALLPGGPITNYDTLLNVERKEDLPQIENAVKPHNYTEVIIQKTKQQSIRMDHCSHCYNNVVPRATKKKSDKIIKSGKKPFLINVLCSKKKFDVTVDEIELAQTDKQKKTESSTERCCHCTRPI